MACRNRLVAGGSGGKGGTRVCFGRRTCGGKELEGDDSVKLKLRDSLRINKTNSLREQK